MIQWCISLAKSRGFEVEAQLAYEEYCIAQSTIVSLREKTEALNRARTRLNFVRWSGGVEVIDNELFKVMIGSDRESHWWFVAYKGGEEIARGRAKTGADAAFACQMVVSGLMSWTGAMKETKR